MKVCIFPQRSIDQKPVSWYLLLMPQTRYVYKKLHVILSYALVSHTFILSNSSTLCGLLTCISSYSTCSSYKWNTIETSDFDCLAYRGLFHVHSGISYLGVVLSPTKKAWCPTHQSLRLRYSNRAVTSVRPLSWLVVLWAKILMV